MDERTLTRRMPDYYQTSKLVQNIHTAAAREFSQLDDRFDAVARQFFVNTADTALDRWEMELGLAVDKRGDDNFRRSRILAKMRGRGTTTLVMVRGVAQSFSDAPVTVTEQPAQYRFTLRFAALDAGKLRGLRDAIEEIKPAHLTCNVLLQYAGASAPGLRLGGRQSVAVRVTVHPYVTPAITANPVLTAGGFLATGIKITV